MVKLIFIKISYIFYIYIFFFNKEENNQKNNKKFKKGEHFKSPFSFKVQLKMGEVLKVNFSYKSSKVTFK